ncbi:MAG TPA: Do family serine endopeptidase, partial [Pirellulales bacterium]|nr:Do family serine endopeptidase [Pirellulales bacterium]
GVGAAVLPHMSATPAANAQVPVRETRQTLPGDTSQAEGLSAAFRSAAHTVMPAVVTITTTTKPKQVRGRRNAPEQGQRENPFKGTPFEDFFKDNPQFGGQFGGGQFGQPGEDRQSTPRRMGSGSGVIIDSKGVILTNNHVVEGADEVTVKLADGREFVANDIKTDPQTDLAIVRIKGAGTLPAAKLGNSDALEIGDWVIAIGSPFELDQTVSAGIISGKGRELRSGQRTRYLQTDAAINPGNSGGPLVNLRGEVVGINTAIASTSGAFQGIGFTIPSNVASWVVGQLEANGSVRRAYLGVGIEAMNGPLAEKFGVERNDGVLVAEIFSKSPASKAGFKEGDVITAFAGKAVHNPRDLQEVVEQSPMNSDQKVDIVRDGKEKTLTVHVEALPDNFGHTAQAGQKKDEQADRSGYHSDELGMDVSDLTEDVAEKLGLGDDKGVVITDVEADGAAADAGLRTGMLISKVDRKPVENVDQFKALMKDQSLKDGVLLQVRTESGKRFIVVRKS